MIFNTSTWNHKPNREIISSVLTVLTIKVFEFVHDHVYRVFLEICLQKQCQYRKPLICDSLFFYDFTK